ncbi:MAG: dihydroorotase family protein [Nitrososphaerota archaeon]|nr:dihydroorotase family protein [Nitrososphaerota archaeon]
MDSTDLGSEFSIKGAWVWHRDSFQNLSVGIRDEKIVEISKKAHEKFSRNLDASGKYLIPGLVDLHVHTRDPGFTHKEDFKTATMAAAAGGVTTIIDMPNLNPAPNTADIYEAKINDCKQKTLVDFNSYALPTRVEEIPKIANLGAAGFKFFMILPKGDKPVYPYLPETAIIDYGKILLTLQEIAKTNLPCVVHPLEPEIWREGEAQIAGKENRHDVDAYLDCYSYRESLALTTSTAMLILIANSCGAKLQIAHVCWRPQLELANTLKTAGYNFTTEINPWAFFLSREDNKRLGPFSHGLYHKGEDQDSIYGFLENGTVDIIGTDHAPHTKQELENGRKDFFASPKGTPVLQDYLRLFLSAINDDKLTLDTFVKLASENPAKRAQIYPKKGAVEVGSDADLVLVDMKKEYTIREDKVYSKCGWTPWNGIKVKGSQEIVFLRGKAITRDYDNVVGSPGNGEYVKPTIQN